MYQTRQENKLVEDLSGKGTKEWVSENFQKQKSQFFFSGQEKSRKIEKGT